MLSFHCTIQRYIFIGENNCLTDFENTAAFSRDYQSAQDCMCDTEHMLECSGESRNSNGLSNMHITNSDLDHIVEQFQVIEIFILYAYLSLKEQRCRRYKELGFLFWKVCSQNL